MKIVFLASARRDLDWFRRYYEGVFTEGAVGARRQYQQALQKLRDNPRIGHPTEEADYRVLPLLRTPFSIIYRLANGRIEIIHVRDGRRGEAGQKGFP